jgi:uncharacterized repeat protein (TIGR03943 family)
VSWDPRRVLRATILVVWTSFFIWLLVTGEVYRYIGLRTHWVVVFGAITLTIATVAQVLSLRSERSPQSPTRGEVAGYVLLLCPVLVVLMIPAPSLGALAASRKATGGVLSSDALIPPPSGGQVSFVDIHFASASERYAADAGISDGYRVELTGFVTHPGGTPAGGFALTRFFISCCAADAIPYSVEVQPGSAGTFDDNTWLTISGALYKTGDQYVLRADDVAKVPEPKDPYIY